MHGVVESVMRKHLSVWTEDDTSYAIEGISKAAQEIVDLYGEPELGTGLPPEELLEAMDKVSGITDAMRGSRCME